jgi:hypothetical protein
MAPTPRHPPAPAAVGGQPLLRAVVAGDDALAMAEMLQGDLAALAEEARKQEGFGTALTSFFTSSDSPDVRQLAQDALADLSARKHGMSSVDALRKSQV